MGSFVDYSDIRSSSSIPVSHSQPEPVRRQRAIKRRESSPEIIDNSDSPPIHRQEKRLVVITQPLSSGCVNVRETDGYQSIWEAALHEPPSSTSEEFEMPEKKPVAVVPIPRYQATQYLNKWTATKRPLNEPSFKIIKNRG